ncbi:MAG: hypothetical protein WB760_14285 [Xanthobacteraceae bacterium]
MISELALALVVAAAASLLFGQICVRLHEATQSKRYAAQRRRRQEIFARLQDRFKLPPYQPYARADGLLDLVASAHLTSIAAQRRYQRQIVRSSASLALAFVALAASVTLAHNFPTVKKVLTSIDLIALIFVLYHFVTARRSLSLWIDSRVRTELLRQYVFLSVLFPSAPEFSAALDLTSSFEKEQERIDREIINPLRGNLAEAIRIFWKLRYKTIHRISTETHDLNPNLLRLYFNDRCLKQVAWFSASRERVNRIDENRVLLLKVLYGTSIVLASAKLISLYAPLQLDLPLVEMLALALLITTGGAAALTAFYVGQNARSLIHRYHAQELDAMQWVNDFDASYRNDLMVVMNGDTFRANNEMRTAILHFEGLMIKELTDWVDISEHDSIELGP